MLNQIKKKFFELTCLLWDVAHEYETSNPEIYDQITILAIDCDELEQKIEEIINQLKN